MNPSPYITTPDGTQLYVKDWGPRDGPVVVFSHGWPLNADSWESQMQFLAEKARTEEELFHTFNALRDAGKQLVMTSDRPPDELQSLEQRLGERFGSGLVVSVEPPDIHVRRAILGKRARLDQVAADPALIEEIAARVVRLLDNPEDDRGELLRPELVVRASSVNDDGGRNG